MADPNAPAALTAAETAQVNLFKRMKFTDDAAKAILGQGYEDLDDLKDLDTDEVSNLCKIIRRPGGTVAAGGADHGSQVSLVAETNLRLAIFYVRHNQDRITRPITRASVTLANVRELRDMKKEEDDYTFPSSEDYPSINERSWPDTFDSLNAFLNDARGEDGIPLGYVIRERPEIPNEADDPATNYDTPSEEMIARAPHIKATNANPSKPHPTYVINNHKVWDILDAMSKDCAGAKVVIKPFQRKKDGRGAYTALYHAKLGTNAINDLVTATEAKLDGFKYKGEGRKQTFSKFVTFQKRQHNILDDLERYGYRGLDARSKVRILNKNIETDTVAAVRTQILADASLQQDYERCTELYQSFINQLKASSVKEPFNISSAHVNRPVGSGHSKHPSNDHIEDKYYTKAEYAKLSEAAKRKLWQMREARGGPPAKKTKTEDRQASSVSKKQYEKLVRKIAALEAKASEGISSESDSENTPPKSNRTNKSLTRNGTTTKGK